MRASIIIVSYNSAADLHACLDSAMRNVQDDDEIIVVDNASEDGSAALVRSEYPQVQLIENSNSGYAGGNNLGASAASGEYLVFLNPDTVMMPQALDALLAPLCVDPTVGLATACLVHRANPQLINTCGNTMHYTGLTYCRGANQPLERYQQDCEVDSVSGAAFAIRSSLFAQLGGFDEGFFMYVEDSDLSLRARLAGYSCRYVAAAVVQHDYSMAYSPRKAFYIERNRYLMLLQNITPRTLLALLPGLLLGEVVTWGFLLLKGPRYWAVKGRVYRSLWQQRRRLTRRQQRSQERERAIIGQLTYRLEFAQIASPWLAALAGALFHPPFKLAQLLLRGAR